MTPEAVIDRYLATATRAPFDPEAFALLLGTDADLLSRWLQLLNCPAEPARFVEQVAAMAPERFHDLAMSQALAVLTVSGSVRLSFDQWQSVLSTSLVGELLAAEVGLDDPVAIRWRVLLAASGVNLAHDPLLMELLTFRGARRELLEDASVIHRLFAVVDAMDVADPLISRETVEALLGIDPERYEQLLAEAAERCNHLLERLGLAADADYDSAERLWLRMQIDLLERVFPAGGAPRPALVEAHELACRRLFGRVAELYLADSGGQHLMCLTGSGPQINLGSQSSAIARCARLGERTEIVDRADQAVADRQVLHRLGSDDGVCLALPGAGPEQPAAGVVVFALDDDVDQETAMGLYAASLGRVLGKPEAGAGEGGVLVQYRNAEERRLRELVHEVNNPLSIVNNYLHLLQIKVQDDPDAVEQLRIIASELRRAGDLVAEARNVPAAVAEPASSAVAQDDVDPNELVRQVVALHQAYARESGVSLTSELADGAPPLRTNEQKLAQVLNNLIRNAIEAAAGETTVRTVAGVYRESGEGLLLEVQDSGPGLPREMLMRLSEPKQSTKGDGHSGLGLQIVHRLVTELNGALDVFTAPGQGTRFSIFLPVSGPRE